jgi:hypothetical protein
MILELETVDQPSARFNRCFETLEAGDGSPRRLLRPLCALWRFQLQGPDAFAAGLRSIAVGAVSVKSCARCPTASGFATEHEETQHGAKVEVTRPLALRGARRPDHRGRRLLQRRMGRGVAGPPRGRGPDAPALNRKKRLRTKAGSSRAAHGSAAGPWSDRSRP